MSIFYHDNYGIQGCVYCAPDKRRIEGNSKFFSDFSIKTCFDPSLKVSRWDGSNDGAQHMF